MKGLLLKDWYMMNKYCRVYLFVAIAFIAASLVNTDNMFFVIYPTLFCSMIPINLIGYDERSRWEQYSKTAPYTKKQIVSAKYLIGLFTQLAVLIVTGIVQGAKMIADGNIVSEKLVALMLLLLIVSTFSTSISLPFIFKLGVEKGRMAYYVMIGFVCGAGVLSSGLLKSSIMMKINLNIMLAIFVAVGIGIYIFSWYMSIIFYKKREE